MSGRTHAEVCAFFGITATRPAPWWTPYAIERVRVVVELPGGRKVWGGAMECGACGYGIDMLDGIGPNGQPVSADKACPRCGATERAA